MKPSDFPRDLRFRTAGPAFIEDGIAHLRSYKDVLRVMTDNKGEEFSQDHSYWAPQNQRLHISWYFLWAMGVKKANGDIGRHGVLREIMEPWFRTKAVRTIQQDVEGIAKTLVRQIIEKGTGSFNLPDELAHRLSLRTICSLFGLPIEREKWINDQFTAFGKTPALDQIKREPQEVEDYFWEVVHHRKQHPQDQLIDVIIAAWKEKKITDLELLGYIWGTLAAGTDTTGTNIVNAFSLLGEFTLLDEARARLDDEKWFHRAGEEILRFGTPFPAGPSLAVKDIKLDSGLEIPAMTQIRVWFSAANRDAAINGENAHAKSTDEFDVNRWPNHHVAFGIGMHYCLGSQLARLETRIALQTALRYLPELEFDETQPFERHGGLIDGVKLATFRFNQHKAEQLLHQL